MKKRLTNAIFWGLWFAIAVGIGLIGVHIFVWFIRLPLPEALGVLFAIVLVVGFLLGA